MKKHILFVFLFMFLFINGGVEVKADLRSENVGKSCETLISEGILNTQSENVLFDGSGYDANCIYTYTYKTTENNDINNPNKGEDFYTCAVFQVAFNLDGTSSWDSIGRNGSVFQMYKIENVPDTTELRTQYFELRAASCPATAIYEYSNHIGNTTADTMFDLFTLGATGNGEMTLAFQRGQDFEVPQILVPGPNMVTSCADSLGDEGVKLLKTIKNLFMILVPLILIVLASIDFATAVFSSEEGNMKKCQAKFIKRLIIAVIIFLVPSILHLLLSIASNIWPNIDASMCGIF